jgi:serine/threonine protein kinase
MELLHQPGEIIAERYRILDILGQGGVGTTYEAQDLPNSQRVALKALSLRRMSDWKMMELFEREARILSQLKHPAIPRYLDYFQVDTAQDRSFYIAQQLAPGKSLAVLVENGWYPDQSAIQGLATQVLEILVYLHSLTPPVVHRDIKPQNIIRQENGRVFLVDFGAVQDTYHNTVTGGSTVVGTYGYMAPEQFRGQAVLSTDLYGLGTTLLFLLTRKSPADLPQRKLKIDFRSHVKISKKFADWLEKMLEPVIEDRFSSATGALAVLRGEQALSSSLAQKPRPPKDTPISLTDAEGRLVVEIPPVWLSSPHIRLLGLLSLIWNGFLFLMLWIIKESHYPIHLHLFTVRFLIVFGVIGLLMLVTLVFSAGRGTYIEIDQQNFRIEWRLLGWWLCEKIQGPRSDINQVGLSDIDLLMNEKPLTVCVLRSKSRKHRFGLFFTQQENEWLVGEITTFLEKMH